MSEHLYATKTVRAMLGTNASLDCTFNLPVIDTVHIKASAWWHHILPIDPSRRMIQILRDGEEVPLASKTSTGLSVVSRMDFTPEQTGAYRARVINKEDGQMEFTLNVCYPTEVPISTMAVELLYVQPVVDQLVAQVSVHLHDGENQSGVRFPKDDGSTGQQNFTVPPLRTTIDWPWPMDNEDIVERVNDINSSSVSVEFLEACPQYARGAVRLNISFESTGREVVGTYAAHLNHMKAGATFGLKIEDGRLTYDRERVETSFSCDIDLVDVWDWVEDYILDPLTDFRSNIRNGVKSAMAGMLARADVCDVITNALNKGLASRIGEGRHLLDARIEGGEISVRYY